ncbi:hypothetical protein ACFQ0B_80185 [Nonomuraea thailandensis]
MHSPDLLGLDTRTVRRIEIRARNRTASTLGAFYFITDLDTSWNEAKKVAWRTRAGEEGYTIYTIDMGQNSHWAGKVRRLRLDPSAAAGSFDVDYIRPY